MSDLPRPAIRFPAQIETVEIISKLTAHVVDESQSGIGVLVSRPAALSIGQVVEIVYDGTAMKAAVRRMDDRDNGQTFIGLQWA